MRISDGIVCVPQPCAQRWRTITPLFVLALLSPATFAQYPSKPIRLMVPNAPGGGADATGRLFGGALSQALATQVIIDNRAGAGGNIAAEIAAKSAADGYTLTLGNVSHAISVSLYRKLGYDMVKDLAPIALLVTSSYGVTVNPAVPAKSINELIALARARPGSLNYGSTANGTFLGGVLLCDMTGVKMTNVAYKGAGAALVALMSGEIEVALTSLASTLTHIRSGKLRVLAVSSAKRSPVAPDLPTVSEAGVAGYEATSWYGLMAPTGTPQDIISRLNTESLRIVRQPEMRAKFIAAGVDPTGSTPEQFGSYLRSEIDKWGKVVRATGMRIE